MNRSMLALTAAVIALGCVSALAQGYGKNTSANPSKNPPQQLSQAGPSYVIGADDTLLVSVSQEPELTNRLPVRADGMISMPLLNDVRAAGLTPMQLAASITEKLKKYIKNPNVTVVITQISRRKIDWLQALASAEFTQFEEQEKVFWAWLEMVKGAERKYKKQRGRYGDLSALCKAHLVRKLFESDTAADASGKAQANFSDSPMRMLFQVTSSEDGRHFRASIGDRCLRVNADDMGGEWSVCCCLSPSLHRDFEDSLEGPIISVAR